MERSGTYVVPWELATAYGRRFGGVVRITADGPEDASDIVAELLDVDYLIPRADPGSMGHHTAWEGCIVAPIPPTVADAIGWGDDVSFRPLGVYFESRDIRSHCTDPSSAGDACGDCEGCFGDLAELQRRNGKG